MTNFSRYYFRISLLAGVVIFLFFYFLSLAINGREYLFSFFSSYEKYNVDELFVALVITGLLGLLHSLVQIKKMSKEIARRVEAENSVDWISSHDPTTGLPNQKMLESFFSRIERGNGDNNFAVFSVEINRFRNINDLLGYDHRNDILKLVAQRLLYLFPDNVYKLRGDEFLILKPSKDNTDLLSLARRIVRNICTPIGINGFTFSIAANIGVARSPEDASSLIKVLQHSDCALQVAKKLGRNQVKAFSPVMQDDLQARARFEMDFKAALKNKALSSYYQPLVDLQSNTLVGFEALARWEQAPGQFIPPAQFIALAEETGAITELTEQLLRQACLDALEWPSHTFLSFNISPGQLCDKRLVLRIMTILDETGFPSDRLEIEVTESALFQDANAAGLTLKKLSDEGIKIALDDFGTGYSNLSQLCNFPFDKLKIDKSFIDTFLYNEKQDKIVRAIISLAGALNVKVTAEGIEDASQLSRLQELGCHIGQGYLLGKPAPQADRQKVYYISGD
ncbi:putative bifunctional diguanylate cyclase/phosphodiesterase (plasmid) [Rahnella aceris]